MFLFTPAEWKLSKWMKTPFVKFVSQMSQFTVFLVLLVMAAFRNDHKPSVVGKLSSTGFFPLLKVIGNKK